MAVGGDSFHVPQLPAINPTTQSGCVSLFQGTRCGLAQALEGASAGLGKGHAPEVGVRGDEFHGDVAIAVSVSAVGNNPSLNGLACVLVH